MSQEKSEPTKLPTPPAGMITIAAPDGFNGHIFAPDPEGWISAKAISKWLRKGIPKELEEEVWLYQEAYARSHMLEFHITELSGKPIAINETTLLSMDYPNIFAQLIVDHTEGLISKARNKKKLPGP